MLLLAAAGQWFPPLQTFKLLSKAVDSTGPDEGCLFDNKATIHIYLQVLLCRCRGSLCFLRFFGSVQYDLVALSDPALVLVGARRSFPTYDAE